MQSQPAGPVVVLRALGLGDFLTGVPAYRALRRGFPRCPLYLAAPAALASLVPLTGAIDGLLPTGELQPIDWPGPCPAVGVDLHGRGPASHTLVAALRPGRLIVFGGPHGGGFRGPQWRPDEHEVARWCRLCQESGIPADPADLYLAPPPDDGAAAWWPQQVTVLHPGAASASRRWPADRFAVVAAQLSQARHRVVISGSAAERSLARRVASMSGAPDVMVAAGRTTLLELARLVASARLVISGDTGVSHLATAYARPSVTLLGPTPPAEWGPPPISRHQVLWAAAPGHRGDPHGSRLDPALAGIPAEAVLDAAGRALASSGPAYQLAGGEIRHGLL